MITIPSRFVIFGQKWAKIEKIDLKIFCWPERKWGVLFDHCSQITSNSSTSNYPSWYAKFGSSIHRPIRSNSLMALVWSGRRNRFFLARVWTENSILMLVLHGFCWSDHVWSVDFWFGCNTFWWPVYTEQIVIGTGSKCSFDNIKCNLFSEIWLDSKSKCPK